MPTGLLKTGLVIRGPALILPTYEGRCIGFAWATATVHRAGDHAIAKKRNGCVWHVGSDHSQRQRLIIIVLLAMIEVPFFPLLMIMSGICSYQCDVYWNWLPFMAVSSQMRVRNAHACSQRSARRLAARSERVERLTAHHRCRVARKLALLFQIQLQLQFIGYAHSAHPLHCSFHPISKEGGLVGGRCRYHGPTRIAAKAFISGDSLRTWTSCATRAPS